MINNVSGTLLLLLFFIPALGQPISNHTADTTLAASAATTTFYQAVDLQKEVYNGPEHVSYLPNIEGFAYFETKEWLPGAVLYDDIWYPNLLLKYDQMKDKLVLQRPDAFAIELRSDKATAFQVPGHLFVRIDDGKKNGLKPGFYDQLSSGALTILARRSKGLEERLEETRARQRFVETTTYYAVKGDTYSSIKNLRSILDLTGDKKREVQQQLKKNNIKFKKDRDLALRVIAETYNKTAY